MNNTSVNLSEGDSSPFALPSKPRPSTPTSAVKMPQVSISLGENETVRAPLPSVERDPDYTSVELPSQFHFYNFKELAIGSIRVKHQAKFARAAKEQSTRITVETISSLLGDGISAMDLTIPDFFWVMYWLRMNNFSKSPLTHRAVCRDTEHNAAVERGEKKKDSLVTLDIVSKSKIKETFLDVAAITAFQNTADLHEFLKGGYTLSAPLIRDTIELEDKWADREDFQEIEFMADAASCIRSTNGELVSLEKRIEFVGNLTPDALNTLNEFRVLVQTYGVEEKISTKCKDCNAVIENEISITAFDFL